MGDKGEGGVKNLKKWVSLFIDGSIDTEVWNNILSLRSIILIPRKGITYNTNIKEIYVYLMKRCVIVFNESCFLGY